MRRLALLVALGLAGCGAEETGESGGCAAALVHDGMAYAGTGIEAGRGLRKGGLVEEGFEAPGCNDGGGPEPDRPASVFAVRGVSPDVAVIDDDGSLYLNTGYFIELPGHPLHHLLPGESSKRRWGRSPCTIDGRVLETFSVLWMETQGGRRMSVAVDVRTRIKGFDRAGLPYLEEGDAIRVYGRCGRDAVNARRIEPRP